MKSRYLRALESALQLTIAVVRASYRLAGQACDLRVERSVEEKQVASRSGDEFDHGALDIAVLSGHPHGLDLHFLNEVDSGSARATPLVGAVTFSPVDEKLVLVHARTEGGHERLVPPARSARSRRALDLVVDSPVARGWHRGHRVRGRRNPR